MKTTFSLRLLALLLVALFLLAACQKGGPVTEPTTEGESTSAETPTEEESKEPSEYVGPLDIVKDGKSEYKIVRPEVADEAEIQLAVDLAALIKEKTGVRITIDTDFLRKGESHPENEKLILIGNTNYPESQALYETMTYGKIASAVSGTKYAIALFGEGGKNAAYDAFSKLCNSALDGENLSIDQTWEFSRAYSTMLNYLPYYTTGVFDSVYDSSLEGKMIVVRNTNEDEYNAYIERLSEFGLEYYADTKIGKNCYQTYRNDKIVLNTMYLASDNAVRLIADPLNTTSLPPKAEDNKYTATSQSSVTQVGLEYDYNGSSEASFQIGMQYIVKLADSSFIIVDGGYNYAKCHQLLYNKLCELADDKNNIVISAWFLTHFHGDHHGVIKNFGLYASKGVKVERFIFNCPSAKQLESANSSSSLFGNVMNGIFNVFPKAEKIVARPGQVFHLRNAVITMYGTFDLVEPFTVTNLNDTCLVFRVEIEGQSILFTGDSNTTETNTLVRIYGKSLASDFVQVIHHGASGGSVAFYQLVDPQIVLWPLGRADYDGNGNPLTGINRRTEEWNQWFFDKNSKVKEIHLAGKEQITIPLPYSKVT